MDVEKLIKIIPYGNTIKPTDELLSERYKNMEMDILMLVPPKNVLWIKN